MYSDDFDKVNLDWHMNDLAQQSTVVSGKNK